MRALCGVVVACCVSLSCLSTRQQEEAHAARVAAIDAEYGAMEREAWQRVQPLLASIDEFRKFLVAIKPGSQYSPVERVDEMLGLRGLLGICAKASEDAKNQIEPELVKRFEQIAQECYVDTYAKHYLPALRRRYYQADLTWALKQWDGKTDLEALCAYLHNTAVLADIAQERRQVEGMLQEQITRIRARKSAAIMRSAEQRDEEIALAREEHRQRMMALSNALSTMGQSSTNQSTPSQSSCTSDYTCGIGFRCLKNNFASQGVCVRAESSFGVTDFSGPRPSSIGPKVPMSTDCGALGCPAGYRCDFNSGACLR